MNASDASVHSVASSLGSTDLKVRRVDFAFDESTPLQWNPNNPMFGFVMLTLSFLAPPFERYMVAGTRMAMPHIRDPDVAAEADAFLRQEALHARAHRNHVSALTAQHPGLAELNAELQRRFDHLLDTKPLAYHLAYAADIEATFTPMFNMWLRHRDQLFDNGNPDVAPLFLWHLVEEIEHRSSAYKIYNAVVPDPWYRLRVLPNVLGHILGCHTAICRGLDAHVPLEHRLAPAKEMALGWPEMRAKLGHAIALGDRRRNRVRWPSPLASVPTMEQLTALVRLARAQYPRRSPTAEETPPFADEWVTDYEHGRDVVHWYQLDASTESTTQGEP
jgi:predicted metal-dependent hydrolase